MNEHYCENCKYAEHGNIGLICTGQKGMPHTIPYGWCDGWKSAKQTNADRIRSMTDEDLAEFISGKGRTFGEEYEGYMSALEWLKQEAGE